MPDGRVSGECLEPGTLAPLTIKLRKPRSKMPISSQGFIEKGLSGRNRTVLTVLSARFGGCTVGSRQYLITGQSTVQLKSIDSRITSGIITLSPKGELRK
jgi:hypothetical protein